MFDCPQCGCETERLDEGYCPDCTRENSEALRRHNFEFDRWERMTAQERDAAIRSAQ